jgi:hypothetical protein
MPPFTPECGKSALIIGPFNKVPKLTPQTVRLWEPVLLSLRAYIPKRVYGHSPVPAVLAHVEYVATPAGRAEKGDRIPHQTLRVTWRAMWREWCHLD